MTDTPDTNQDEFDQKTVYVRGMEMLKFIHECRIAMERAIENRYENYQRRIYAEIFNGYGKPKDKKPNLGSGYIPKTYDTKAKRK
jgi:hypothetical protein